MLLRYIQGKSEPAYPALYSVFYLFSGEGESDRVYDGLARWTGDIFGRVNTPEGGLVEGETEIIAFFQFPANKL